MNWNQAPYAISHINMLAYFGSGGNRVALFPFECQLKFMGIICRFWVDDFSFVL